MVAEAIWGLGILLCGMQFAGAQTLQRPSIDPPVAVDRPTQRWLPLPQGDGIDQNSQVRLLQQLQELMSPESGGSPLPKLSESQLQRMEGALEQLRKQIGEDKLPNLEDIPQEWINEALADPLIRKQAQQLLEQYARDRKLPTTPRAPEPPSSDAVPFPRRQPPANNQSSKNGSDRRLQPNSGKQSDRLQNSDLSPKRTEQPGAPEKLQLDNKPTDNKRSDNQLNEKDLEKPNEKLGRPGGASSIPKKPDAERIEALKQLFEKLKKIEGERKSSDAVAASSTPSKQSPNTSQNMQSRNESGVKRPGDSANRPLRSTNPTPRLNNPLGENGMRSRMPNGVPDEQQPLQSDPDETDSQGSTMPKLEENLGGLNSELRPDNPLLQDPKTDSASPLKTSPKNSNKLPNSKLPRANPADVKADSGLRSDPRLKSKPSAGQSSKASEAKAAEANGAGAKRNSQSPNSGGGTSQAATGSALDLKTQLERHGLGSALKSLVEKTLREQGELDSKQKEAGAKGAEKKAAKDSASVNKSSGKQAPTDQKSASKSIQKASDVTKPSDVASSKAAKQPQNSSAAAPPKTNSGQGSSMSGLRDLAAEVWGAIGTTPGDRSSGSGAKDEVSSGAGSGAELGFSWGGAAWVLGLVVVTMLGLFLLLAKKRIELATAAREAEANVAKELLADGIRTRADVVRAFHRFVLRRAQPVATWWNHRYVASRLTQATPQLGSVIMDLATVYEQARYLPPEVELSSDDLNRVQSALKQCVAGSV